MFSFFKFNGNLILINPQSTEIDDTLERLMKIVIYPIKAIDYGSYGAVIGGLAMMVGSFGYGVYKRKIVKIYHFFEY